MEQSNFSNSSTDWFQLPGTENIVPSHAEFIIRQILQKAKANFFTEVSFKGLRFENKQYPRFDFWLPDFNTLIEYDGEMYHNDANSIQKDCIKNEFCKTNKIILIRYNKKHYHNLDSEIYNLLASSVLSQLSCRRIASPVGKKTFQQKKDDYKRKVEQAFKPRNQGGSQKISTRRSRELRLDEVKASRSGRISGKTRKNE